MKTLNFWNTSGTIKLDPEALHQFLTERGFHTFRTYEEDKILVEVRGKIIHRVSNTYIRDVCWQYIYKEYTFLDASERNGVIKAFHSNTSILSMPNLLLLEEIEVSAIQDRDDASYVFFENCVIKVTAEGATKMSYEDIDGYIWQDDIINADFTANLPAEIKPEGDFYEFFLDITKHDIPLVEAQNRDSLVTIIGYFLHRLKVQSSAKALILMDSYRDGLAQGGSGKSLFSQAFGKIRPMVFQDGKFFTKKDRFALSNLKYGTRIMIIDDVPAEFDFSKLFPMITNATVVERKHKDKIVIPFEDSPKVILSTNYTIEGKGEAFLRRKIEFILSDTYGGDYTPVTKLGHEMFTDWKEDEWAKFHLFMLYCLQMYLLLGIVQPKFNVAERTLKMNASSDFIQFVNKDVKLRTKYNKKEVFDSFKSKFPDHQTIEQNTFTRWLKFYAAAYTMEVVENHSGDDNFFELIFEKEVKDEE